MTGRRESPGRDYGSDWPWAILCAEQAPVILRRSEAPGRRMKVLVVDDDEAVADVLAGMLEDLGCAVETRFTVRDALQYIESGPAPELVLSDIRMPGGQSGIDLARMVKQRYPGLRLVLMTGYADQGLEGVDCKLLPKPIAQSVLVDLLRSIRAGSGTAPL